MIDATLSNFETEVIAASQTLPVLVDLWAPWCAPCRTLGPVLEKLETEYGGRFKLVKVDTEAEPDLAAAFGVRSVPMVVLMQGGQAVDGFVGALPEGQIRNFLDKHVAPAAEPAPAEPAAEPAAAADRLVQLQQQLATDPADDAARAELVRLLLRQGELDAARDAFAPLQAKRALDRRADALAQWLAAIDSGVQDEAALRARIGADKRDFAARHALARHLLAQQQWTAAMDELLEILMRNKDWDEGAARKTYLAILELLQMDAAPAVEGQPLAADPLLDSYRRRLSMVVLS